MKVRQSPNKRPLANNSRLGDVGKGGQDLIALGCASCPTHFYALAIDEKGCGSGTNI